jgi:hypothetical protein
MAKQGRHARIKEYVSPDVRDVIFYEEVDNTTFNECCYELCVTEHQCEEDFKLVYIGPVDRNGKRKLYYAAERAEQWKYNYNYTGVYASGGGKFEVYERSYIILREDWILGNDAYGDPIVEGGADPEAIKNLDLPFGEGFVYSGMKQRRSDIKELDACYIMVVYRFAKPCDMRTFMFDPECNVPLPVTISTVARSTNPVATPMDEDGFYTELRDINCNWTQVITTKGLCIGDDKVYETYINFRWPAVLDNIEFNPWYRLDRSYVIFPRVVWLRRAMTIPTKSTLTRSYFEVEQALDTLPVPVAMLPNSMQYSCPSFSINVPACLHDTQSFVCDYGTANPVWDSAALSTRVYDPTELSDGTVATDWPDSLVISVTQKPHKGGYVVDIITIESPLVTHAP